MSNDAIHKKLNFTLFHFTITLSKMGDAPCGLLNYKCKIKQLSYEKIIIRICNNEKIGLA